MGIKIAHQSIKESIRTRYLLKNEKGVTLLKTKVKVRTKKWHSPFGYFDFSNNLFSSLFHISQHIFSFFLLFFFRNRLFEIMIIIITATRTTTKKRPEFVESRVFLFFCNLSRQVIKAGGGRYRYFVLFSDPLKPIILAFSCMNASEQLFFRKFSINLHD